MKKTLMIIATCFGLLLCGCSDMGKEQKIDGHTFVKVTSLEYDDGDVRVNVAVDSSTTAEAFFLWAGDTAVKNADGDKIKFKWFELGSGAIDGVSFSEESESEFVHIAKKGKFTLVFGLDEVKSKKYEFSIQYKGKTYTWIN